MFFRPAFVDLNRRRLVGGDKIVEFFEIRVGIAWARSGFWMVLYREYRFVLQPDASNRLIVEIDFGDHCTGFF